MIGEYFEANNTGNVLLREARDGVTPFVTASGVNNGVVGYIDASNYEKIRGNSILVGGKTFTLTYQAKEYVSNDSHNFEIHLRNTQSAYVYLFLVTAIRASLSSKYSWGDAVTKEKLLKQKILLPADKTGEPNFEFMDRYMREMNARAKRYLEYMQVVSTQS